MITKDHDWPGVLGQPISEIEFTPDAHLPGGSVFIENADEYNKKARAFWDDAVKAERIRKLPALLSKFELKKGDYTGLVKALAALFPRKYRGDIDGLKEKFGIKQNKTLAIAMAAEIVPGFQVKQSVVKPGRFDPISCDVETRKIAGVSSGPIRRALAEGRTKEWYDDRLRQLLRDYDELDAAGYGSAADICNILKMRKEWRGLTLPTLNNRLSEASAKGQHNPIIDEVVARTLPEAMETLQTAKKLAKRAISRKNPRPEK